MMKNLTYMVLVILILAGCKKEKNADSPQLKTSSKRELTVDMAKQYFDNKFSTTNSISFGDRSGDEECVDLIPHWVQISEITNADGFPLVILSIKNHKDVNQHGRGSQIVFYIDDQDEIQADLVYYEAKEYDESRPFPINNTYFSGFVGVVDIQTKESRLFPVEDGELLGMIEMDLEDELGGGISTRNDAIWRRLCKWLGIGCGGGCPSAGGNTTAGSGWVNLWNTVTSWLNSNGSGSNGNSNDGGSSNWVGFTHAGFPFYGSPNGESSNGGSSNSNPTFNTLFDGTFFNGEGQTVVNLLEGIIADNNLLVCVEDLHIDLYHCIALDYEGEPIAQTGSGNQNPVIPGNSNELDVSGYIYNLMNITESNNCLSSAISQYQTTMYDMNQGDGSLLCTIAAFNNFDISDEDLLGEMKEECDNDGDCILRLMNCFNKLDAFQQTYGFIFNLEQIELLTFDGKCDDQDDFNEYVLSFVEQWNDQVCQNTIEEFIIEDPSLLECPILNCLYDKLSSQQVNNFICTYLSPSFDSEDFSVLISVNDISSSSGVSTFNTETQQANIQLSLDNCTLQNPNEVLLTAQILHEFVHIELFRQMVEEGLDPNNFEDYYSFWNNWTTWIYEKAVQQGTNEVHHHVMIEYQRIIRPLAESLFILFEGESNGLTIDHFMMSAANGLFYAMELHSSTDPNFANLYWDFENQYSNLSLELNNLNLSLGCE